MGLAFSFTRNANSGSKCALTKGSLSPANLRLLERVYAEDIALVREANVRYQGFVAAGKQSSQRFMHSPMQ